MSEPYYKTHEPPHCPTCDCGADPTEMEMLRRDADRYRWLRDNAGAWEVSRDVGEWTRAETGEKFKPRVYFTAYSTAYGGRTLDEAIDAAMNGANDQVHP